MFVDCPLPTALTAITTPTCPLRLDQIGRLFFQRLQSASPFADEAAFKVLANWTTLIAAADSTKVVYSPAFSGMQIPQSEGTFVGGNDNTTFDGVREYYGENMVTATGTFKNLPSATLKLLDKLTQESLATPFGQSNLTIFPANKDGVMFYQKTKTILSTTAGVWGIPIYNFRVGSRGTEGYNAADVIPFSFDLPKYWDRELASAKVSFDPYSSFTA